MPLTLTEPSVAELLKRDTYELHVTAEKLLGPQLQQVKNQQDYFTILKMFYGYFQPLEQLLESWLTGEDLPDYSSRKRAHLILQDLAPAMSTDKWPLCNNLPSVHSLASALGVLYVLEGSALGGKVIARMLLKSQAGLTEDQLHFFNGNGSETGPMWVRFQEYINGFTSHEEEICEAARKTFYFMIQWMKQSFSYETNN